ncbi:hypothetical protein MIND_01031500 [Mycena indigotica]|uniref:Uncharacterized protein n=1 Tax=Mycena indigotica TaxID=2126181 RepID=A0A8H6S8S7_9AGAR|nr:uncharacterized protein MIND_01031500 [Mycena indigotica]KAF7294934.1 hypothetical protein MIND_01031500 [Mycena indigotica]
MVDPQPPYKKQRLASDPPSEPSTSRHPPGRSKVKKSRHKAALSESDDFDEEPEPESDLPFDDDEEYMSEPKATGKRAGGKKSKGKEKEITVMARDERKKRPDTESTLRPKPRQSDFAASSPAMREDASQPKKKLPNIKKIKGAGESTTSAPSTPPVALKHNPPPETKLPLPVVAARKQPVGPQSVDLDLSNPSMYAQLFSKSNTSSGFTRRDKEEERRKELIKMRDEAKAKRLSEAAPPFDLQGQMDKIIRFEERLRAVRSPSVFPNHLAGGLKQIQARMNYPTTTTDPDATLEEGEM